VRKIYSPERLIKFEVVASNASAALHALDYRIKKLKEEELQPALTHVEEKALREFFPQTRQYDPSAKDPRSKEWARRLQDVANIRRRLEALGLQRARLSERAQRTNALHANLKDFIQANNLKAQEA